MIIHRYDDGSEGYRYEIGDRVIVEKTIYGGYSDTAPINSEYCTVQKIKDPDNWLISVMFIKYADHWGPVSCYPWMIRPHPDTLAAAPIQEV